MLLSPIVSNIGILNRKEQASFKKYRHANYLKVDINRYEYIIV